MNLANYPANENGITIVGGVSMTILAASIMMGRIPVVVKETIPDRWKLMKVF
jgi:hypothetical protein